MTGEKYRKENQIFYIFTLIYIITILLSKAGQHIAAGLLLLSGSVALYIGYYNKSKDLLNMKGVLGLFWFGGQGIAAMQLSNLQKDWHNNLWLIAYLFYFFFLIGFSRKEGKIKVSRKKRPSLDTDVLKRLFHCIVIIGSLSTFSFLLEAIILGYIPLFSSSTHAYNSFHITGVHYFTFSCMFVHPLTVIYVLGIKESSLDLKKNNLIVLVIMNLLAFSIAIMCISKFQFLLTLALPIIVYLSMKDTIPWKKILVVGVILGVFVVAMVVFMTVRRNYEPGYLNSIFEMKYENMPMWIQYPYMYIANNYENLNCLVEAISSGVGSYSMGLRMLFPFVALTGLKFVMPQLVVGKVFITKPELNTLTILYDAYYDFGILGVILFGIVLGFLCGWVVNLMKKKDNPITYLLFGQVMMYLMLSFFSTWFSNPTTWFWFAITMIMYIYVKIDYFKGNKQRKKMYKVNVEV